MYDKGDDVKMPEGEAKNPEEIKRSEGEPRRYEGEPRREESFESILRRFKKKIEQEGTLREVRDRKHYMKPSERKRKKSKGRR